MADTVRIGVIGAGQIGTGHLKTYAEIPDAEVVAVADLDQAAADRAKAAFGIDTTYTDYHEMLARDDIDAVDVCLHNRLHMPVAVDALEAGKHVYCEKPMAWSYHDAKKMYEAAQASGKMLHIQLGRIYRHETWCARRLITDGQLGSVYSVTSTHYRRRGRPWVDGYGSAAFVSSKTAGSGALGDFGIYNIARVVFLLGNPELETVSGLTQSRIPMYEERRKSGGFDLEESVQGLVRFAGGIGYSLAEAWAMHSDSPEEDCVYGDRGGLRVEPLSYHTTISDMELSGTIDATSAIRRWNSTDRVTKYYVDVGLPFHRNSQNHWVHALHGRVELLDTAGIALKTALISEGLYLSASLGREVTAAEIVETEPVSRKPRKWKE
jgi:predicted dehydrogenase